jgi:cation:H+ antiporter
MGILLWSCILVIALFVMITGAETFLRNAETIGLRMGISSFVIGVVIVGFGTSLPELTSSLLAILADEPTIVVANAIGSNIANILLIGGVLAFLGKKLTIDRDLLSAELPFFVISTALFAIVVFDGSVTFTESILLVSTLLVYIFYLFSDEYSSGMVVEAVQDEVQHERFHFFHHSQSKPIFLLLLGLAGLLFGGKYVVDSVISIAHILNVAPGVITITAVALGTSLPELVVSIKSLRDNKLSLAIGNIFGSNAFNILVAVGIPGLFTTLPLGAPTYNLGYPMILVASFILLVIGLARKLYRWEGIMFFILYGYFIFQIATYCCTV